MTSTQRAYFESMYRDAVDPWQFETSAYERRKYAITVSSLPRASYRSAFEPGCSVGASANCSPHVVAGCWRATSSPLPWSERVGGCADTTT